MFAAAAERVLWYSAPHQDWDITNGSIAREVTPSVSDLQSIWNACPKDVAGVCNDSAHILLNILGNVYA